MARQSEPRLRRRPSRGRLALLVLLLLIVLAIVLIVMFAGPLSRLLPGRAFSPSQVTPSGPVLRFIFPPETATDRILLKTGVNILLTHEDRSPDKIALQPPPGDLVGSFTWTVIPHQGSHNVRRLIGEAEWQGRVFKLCEAIDDQESPVPKYAERYFPVNNAGVRFRNPERIDQVPFVTFLNEAIAEIPAGQMPIGEPPPARIAAMAERLIPLCTGQTGVVPPSPVR